MCHIFGIFSFQTLRRDRMPSISPQMACRIVNAKQKISLEWWTCSDNQTDLFGTLAPRALDGMYRLVHILQCWKTVFLTKRTLLLYACLSLPSRRNRLALAPAWVFLACPCHPCRCLPPVLVGQANVPSSTVNSPLRAGSAWYYMWLVQVDEG